MSVEDIDALYAITDEFVRKTFHGKVYERAEDYYRSGRVRRPRAVGATLFADVQGTQLYRSSVKAEKGLLYTSCTCPFADTAPCKHMGALLLQWIRDRDSFAIVDEPDSVSDKAGLASSPSRKRAAVAGRRAGSEGSSRDEEDWDALDSDEEQSGLITLLEPLALNEMRNIARQRGWRVKGVTKAEYVTALASLLSNPTETARAVTSLPDSLREALRAAFVADDGSGITATTLAQAMTALRGGAGAAVKPVEAAGLLSDLAGWGLILAWRNSFSYNGSYVLPWEVQRLIPPLPGWCALSPLPATGTRFKDGREVVNALYALWQSIADEEPTLRLTVDEPGERPRRAGLQGWPYDPRELQGQGSKRGRAQTAAQVLSVPHAPYLVDDPFLPALTGAVDRDNTSSTPPERISGPEEGVRRLPRGSTYEEVEFSCHLLRELGLVSVQDGCLVAQREAMAQWLQRPAAQQRRAVGRAYLSLMDWSEIDALLRQNSRLVLWHKPYFPLPYDHFRSWLLRLRHVMLRFLACSGEGWCRITDIEAALQRLWPRFPDALPGDRQSWIAQAWGLGLFPGESDATPADADALTSRRGDTPFAPLPPRTREGGEDPRSGRPREGIEYNEYRPAGARRPTGEYLANAGRRSRGGDADSSGPSEQLASQLGKMWGSDPKEVKRSTYPAHAEGPEEADWEQGQGAFLRLMLEGPLYWLGLAELSYSDTAGRRCTASGTGQAEGPEVVAVRFHGLGDWIWDRPMGSGEELQGERALTVDEASGAITMPPAAIPPQAHTFLGRIARLEDASPERFVYLLFERAAYATFESGISLSDLLTEWERVMLQPIPPILQDRLSQWWKRYGQFRLYEGLGLLELSDEVTLRELEAGTSLTQHIVARLSPRLVLVQDESVESLIREFVAKGYTPKQAQ